MSSWHSYPSLYNVGHRALKPLLEDPVIVEEKVDGSQFSFGKIDGVLRCKSKGKELVLDAPEKLFAAAVGTVKKLEPLLKEGWTYRGEVLSKPKHNALAYDRVPNGCIILFDINTDEETYLPYAEKQAEATRLGLEVVPLLFEGVVNDHQQLVKLLETTSVLGGQFIEGFVIKNYNKFGPDKKVLMGKHVSEGFKEVHRAAWKESNPNKGEFIENLALQYKTPARWNKAIQHLRENGTLTETPKDIGPLIKEVQADILKECREEIIEQMFAHFWGQIGRIVINGLPEWYKDQLLQKQFGDGNGNSTQQETLPGSGGDQGDGSTPAPSVPGLTPTGNEGQAVATLS